MNKGRPATEKEVEYQKLKDNEDLTEFTFHKVGDYTISYTDGNGGTSAVTITIKTTKLTSSKVGRKAFKGIYSKATIKVPKSKVSAYKKLLKAKGCGSKVTISK